MKKQIIFFVVHLLGCCLTASAQQAAIKTNFLHGAFATPNAAFELGLGKKTSVELYWGYNWFEFKDNKKWKHWVVEPEFRWWFCERFNGSFLGSYLQVGSYNIGGTGPFRTLKNNRYEGNFYGGGFSYGYQWMLSNRWAFETVLGIGYSHITYDKYRCKKCAPKIESGHVNYFGPTKLQASFIFFLW